MSLFDNLVPRSSLNSAVSYRAEKYALGSRVTFLDIFCECDIFFTPTNKGNILFDLEIDIHGLKRKILFEDVMKKDQEQQSDSLARHFLSLGKSR